MRTNTTDVECRTNVGLKEVDHLDLEPIKVQLKKWVAHRYPNLTCTCNTASQLDCSARKEHLNRSNRAKWLKTALTEAEVQYLMFEESFSADEVECLGY